MARKVGILPGQVVEAAAELTDRDGLAGLTLTALARHLGIRTPSLYAHVDGLPGLRRELQAYGAHALAAAIRDGSVDTEGAAAMRAFARTYRAFAHEHPGLYELIQHAVSADDDPAVARALAEPVEVVVRSLESLGVEGDDAVHTVRIWRAALHGFVDLECRGGFAIPLGIDDTYERLVESLLAPLTVATPRRV